MIVCWLHFAPVNVFLSSELSLRPFLLCQHTPSVDHLRFATTYTSGDSTVAVHICKSVMASSSQPSSSARETINESDSDFDVENTPPPPPPTKTGIEPARPFLLCKVRVDLRYTKSDWLDGRSNRTPSQAHVTALIKRFETEGIKRRPHEHRMVCRVSQADFTSKFTSAEQQTAQFKGLWIPRDDDSTPYQILNWSDMPPIELLSGQHRKLALQTIYPAPEWDRELWWIVNVYNLTTLPAGLRVELSVNIASLQKEQSSATTFRDMAFIAESLASSDMTIVQPFFGHAPTVAEYLHADRKGDKKLCAAFSSKLSSCAAYHTNRGLEKFVKVLGTPMRPEIVRFCNVGASSAMFTINMAYEMSLSQCYLVSFRHHVIRS